MAMIVSFLSDTDLHVEWKRAKRYQTALKYLSSFLFKKISVIGHLSCAGFSLKHLFLHCFTFNYANFVVLLSVCAMLCMLRMSSANEKSLTNKKN